MSYLKNSYSVCVLELPTEFKLPLYELHQKMLQSNFKELSPSQEFGHGWVTIEDMFKVDFIAENITVGDCIFGGYRFDRKTVPQSLIKKLFREKLREKKALGEKLNKEERKNLKEECRDQLIMRALPKPSMITWIWDLDNAKVYLDTKSTKLIDSFVALFNSSFGVDLSTDKIIDESLDSFLEWLWKNFENRQDITVNDDIILDTGDKTLFKFNGPSLENYLSEIESIKHSKIFKKLNTAIVIEAETYSVGFNSKNTIYTVKLEKKIKHESAATAILDNLDRIRVIQDKIKSLIDEHLAQGK